MVRIYFTGRPIGSNGQHFKITQFGLKIDAGLYDIFIFNRKINHMNPLHNPEHKEGEVAKTIENQTAKLPSDVFLWAAIGAMGISLALKVMGRKHQHDALFV